MTTKNLLQFAQENWDAYQTTISVASANTTGETLVASEKPIYNFDDICKTLFPEDKRPSSADGIYFFGSEIHFVEFKSGFKQNVTKKNFDPERGKCRVEGVNRVCKDFWDIFWENQDRKIKELISKIRFKAVDSYIILEKLVLPNCADHLPGRSSQLVFTVVIDEDGVDGIEDSLADVSQKDVKIDNPLISIRQSLNRLLKQKDAKGNDYFYDRIEVLTATDFEHRLKLTS